MLNRAFPFAPAILLAPTCLADNFGGFDQWIRFENRPSNAAIGVADVNLDNVPDVVSASDDGWLSVLIGLGDGSFQAPWHFPTLTMPRQVEIGDFNGDGWPDVAVVSESDDGNIAVHINACNGAFPFIEMLPVGSDPKSLTLADFDGDGHLDLATSNYGSSNLSMIRGNGDGTFQPQRLIALAERPWLVHAADADDDGAFDLLVSAFDSTFPFDEDPLRVLFNNGSGGFQAGEATSLTAVAIEMSHGDIDGDGHIDLAVILATDVMQVLNGDGTGGFDIVYSAFIGNQSSGVQLFDLEHDGDLDIVASDRYTERVFTFVNDGTGQFDRWQWLRAGPRPQDFAIGDVNLDGYSDLVIASNTPTTSQTVVVMSNLTAPNEGVTIDALDVVFGRDIGGSLIHMFAPDSASHEIISQFGFSAMESHIVELRFEATADDPNAATIDLAVQMLLTTPGGTGRLSLRNWSTGRTDTVHVFPTSQNDELETVSGIEASDYIRDSDGRIELSLRTSVVASFTAFGYFQRVDYLEIGAQ